MTSIITIGSYQSAETGIPFSIGRLADASAKAFTERPRRHNFHLLIWIIDGQGANIIDFEKHHLQGNQLHLVAPAQVQYWEVEQPPTGYYLLFTEELFVMSGASNFLSQIHLFDAADQQQVLDFRAAEAAQITEHFHQMAAEYKQRDLNWVTSLVARLQLLLINIHRQQRNVRPAAHDVPVGQQLTQQFLKLVQANATAEHELAFYANALGVTSGHLSETTKGITGQSAAQLIRKRIVLEAKRLLVYTEQTAAEIAEELQFADASYFGRYFKRETGQTPRQFRADFFLSRNR